MPTPTPQPTSPAPAASSVPVGTKVGQRVPAFTVITLDGVRLANVDFQGKPYLLFFFATW
ncbi:MAG: hypothetical protein EXR47_08325 [Dehalococcoidia bacterium]|nr:hypothetical protein [Dehalococcoidia bacterium]